MRGSAAISHAVEIGRVEFANEEIRRLRVLLRSDIVIAMTSDRLRRDVEATIVAAERETVRAGRITGQQGTLGPVDALLEECRGLMTGILLRSNGSDDAGCATADALVTEISTLARVSWNGITVPGEEDRTTYSTGVIGLKFPGPFLWSLPFAAHEFGHILAQTWQHIPPGGGPATRPLASVLNAAGAFPRQREELWCDFFATFVLGPAYTWALLLRLTDDSGMENEFEDPATELATHPREPVRLSLSIRTLEEMNSSGGRGQAPYAQALRRLRELLPQNIPGASEARLTLLFGRFWNIAENHFPACRHRMSSEVDTLIRQFKGRIPLAPIETALVRDVVSAAWLARIDAWDNGHNERIPLEERALYQLRQITE